MKIRHITALSAALLLGAAGCADLDVANPNQPDTEQALADAGDVQSLIVGSFSSWWRAQQHQDGFGLNLSTVSFQHSAYPANFGMVEFSKVPREPINNDPAFSFYSQFQTTWTDNYRAISAARNGLVALDGDVSLGADEPRARAFAHFVQGLAHGSLALLFDEAYIYDETMVPEDLDAPVGYQQVMEAALGYLDQAIAIAQANTFQLPASWMSRGVSNTEMVRLARSFQARYRALVARTPAEREAVNWQRVISDAEAGITQDFMMEHDGFSNLWPHHIRVYGNFPGWSQVPNFYLGMADQSGRYQDWLATPVDNREPFLYDTPDQRFPQGATVDAQRANPGMYITVPGGAGLSASLGDQWSRADRGTWRWSYYRDYRYDSWLAAPAYVGPATELSVTQLRLLTAEGLYRTGQTGAAAAIVDETRMSNGGLGTASANADCVPRLPSGQCGDLLETIKWEHRLETYHQGFGVSFYNARGWGDLMEGTFLHLPIPSRELQLQNLPVYTTGGVGGNDAAPVGTYGF